MKSGIYQIVNPKGRVYIGSSIHVLQRISNYKKGTAGTQQPRLYNSFLKYGTSNHTFQVIEYCSVEELKDRERFWQEEYDVLSSKGLNCVLVDTVGLPKVHSDVTKHKISKTLTGRKSPHSEESKKNISKGHRKNWQSKQELLTVGRSVKNLKEMKSKLGITFPTLKRRLDANGISDELNRFWEIQHYEVIYSHILPFCSVAKNVKEVALLVKDRYNVSPGTIRKTLKYLGKDVEVYEQFSINRKSN